MAITYKSAGVDIDSIKKSQSAIGSIISRTHRAQALARVDHGFGHYAGIVTIPGGMRIATHTDGVGTKVIVANALGRYDTVGIDCVAMNVNDVICTGATPISFVDYIAASRNDAAKIADIARGLALGAKKGAVPIVGGETAIMPGLFGGGAKFEFDLAGTVVGMLHPNTPAVPPQGGRQAPAGRPAQGSRPSAGGSDPVLGNLISRGDVIVGAYSTGLHSNGYTLARKALDGVSLKSKMFRGGPTVGDALLEPTEIYVKPVLDILSDDSIRVHGVAHITGGSFTKLLRLKRAGFVIDDLPAMPRIMEVVMGYGSVPLREMYRTFNMGVGFCVVAPEGDADAIIKRFSRRGIRSQRIGRICPGAAGVTVHSERIA